jgi:hypothetical protein
MESFQISAGMIKQLEHLWKSNPDASLKDLEQVSVNDQPHQGFLRML